MNAKCNYHLILILNLLLFATTITKKKKNGVIYNFLWEVLTDPSPPLRKKKRENL